MQIFQPLAHSNGYIFRWTTWIYLSNKIPAYPIGHFVHISPVVMTVEDDYCQNDRRRHHKHYAIEVGS